MLDLRPLRSASYRHLVTANWINDCGNWIGEVALAILVYNRTGSALATATLFLALRCLPAVLAPVLAASTEHRPPRIVLPLMYLVEAVVFAVIAISASHFSLPLTLALSAIDGVCAISVSALSRSAMAAGLMADGLLREGNSFMNLGATIATAGGPILAAVLVAWRGAGTALMVDAATFAISAFIVGTATGIRIESDREVGVKGRLKSGAAVLSSRPAVRRLVIATVATFGLSQVAIPIEVIFAKTTLHAGDTGYGLLLTSWGIGMIAGAAVFAVSGALRLPLVLGVGTALVALGYGGLAVSPTLAVACVASFVGGGGNGVAWVAAKTSLQEQIPINNQSAVMSVLDGLNQVVPALGFMAGGALATLDSPRTAYAVSAIGVGLVLAAFLLRPLNSPPLDPPGSAPENGPPDSIDSTDIPASRPIPPSAFLALPQEIGTPSRTSNTPPVRIG
jgi:MFS family permease